MKIKADDREFTTIDEIIDDMINTIDTWHKDRQARAVGCIECYINDWYYDYELTEAEQEEIAEIVTDVFTGDIEE